MERRVRLRLAKGVNLIPAGFIHIKESATTNREPTRLSTGDAN
jgi:hypothetical protein